jgi:hypothetical protein
MTTLILALLLAAADEGPACTGCGKETYGTSVKWKGSPSEAAAQAKKEEKLVFVLHVSGYFEDPKFT